LSLRYSQNATLAELCEKHFRILFRNFTFQDPFRHIGLYVRNLDHEKALSILPFDNAASFLTFSHKRHEKFIYSRISAKTRSC